MQLESQYRRQRGLKGKGAVFTTILMAGSVLNPHPGHVVASLDKGFTMIGGFDLAANLRGRKPNVNTGKLGKWSTPKRVTIRPK